MRKLLLLIALLPSCLFAQDSTSFLKEHFSIDGYMKYMHTASLVNTDYIFSDQLLHNRINTKTTITDNLTLKVEFRNRMFYGDQVRMAPQNYEALEQDNGWVDMSFLWLSQPAVYGHTVIDRAYIDYYHGDWNIKLGRQRINWGMNLAWNPNDLFNAYNFTDFDYEERPGADAVRIQYFTNSMNSIDVAAKLADSLPDMTIAGKYQFNTKGYDIQILGGKYLTDATLGVGWAGNIKLAGFKGEATYFHPYEDFGDTTGALSAGISMDYLFKGGVYVNLGFLYNSLGTNDLNTAATNALFTNITAKNLMPSKYSTMTQVNYSVNPLTSIGVATIYAAGINALFLMPSASYSIRENWDIFLVGQSYLADVNGSFGNAGTGLFLRLKYSY